MGHQLSMQPSPHIRSNQMSSRIMRDVIIALLFPTVGALYFFGYRVLIMIVVGIGSSVFFEFTFQKLMRRPDTIHDLSACVTGYLIALSLPTTAPLWTIVLGTFFAIVIVKQIPGGIGKNFLNPAVAARVMLKIFFSSQITNWVTPGVDAVSTATPLEFLGHFTRTVSEELPPMMELIIGNIGGNIGETSKLLILIGFAYLVYKKVIDFRIPLTTILTAGVVVFVYSGFNMEFTLYHIFSGTLIFASVYMVTDYTSGPLTTQGRIIYAIGIGLLCALLRIIFDLPGGIGFSILIMNILSSVVDYFAIPRVFGHEKPVRNREFI